MKNDLHLIHTDSLIEEAGSGTEWDSKGYKTPSGREGDMRMDNKDTCVRATVDGQEHGGSTWRKG